MRRHRSSSTGLNDDDISLLARVVPGWPHMAHDEQTRITEHCDRLLRQKRWEAARGFQLTQPIRVHIAAQASLLILGLDYECYRRVHSIIVHPTRMIRSRVRPGPVRGVVSSGPITILGEAAHGTGPVVIAWDTVLHDTRQRERGHNVVFHEFAHKIDMLDDLLDGTPPISDPDQRERWIEVCTTSFERLRNDTSTGVLRDYASVNPSEFFAVATEVFFSAPEKLWARERDLYDVLREFYRQDPAARAARRDPSP